MQNTLKALLVSLLSLSAILAISRPATAQGLNVELRCWEGEDVGAPVTSITMTNVGTLYTCRVLASNVSGGAITNGALQLSFGQHPQIPLIANPDLSNYDPGAYFNCSPGGTTLPPGTPSFRPNMVADVNVTFSGFASGSVVTGTWYPYSNFGTTRCFDYNLTPSATWPLDLPAGASFTGRVQFTSGMLRQGASFQTAFSVAGVDLPVGVSFSPVQIPVNVAVPLVDMSVVADTTPNLTRTLAMSGSGSARNNSIRMGAQTGVVVDLYLPYLQLDGGDWSLVTDDAYAPNAPTKLIVFQPDDLQLNVQYRDANWSAGGRYQDFATLEDVALPDTVLPAPVKKVNDTHFRLEFGHLTAHALNNGHRMIHASWAASFSTAQVVQDFLAPLTTMTVGRLCFRSNENPTPVCRNITAAMLTPDALMEHLHNDWIHGTQPNGISLTEAYPAVPLGNVTSVITPPLLPWRTSALRIVQQVPNDYLPNSLGGLRQAKALVAWTGLYNWVPHTFYESSVAPATGSQNDISLRVVPQTTNLGWTNLGTSQGFWQPLSLSPTTTEVRVDCSPSRYGVKQYGPHGRSECSFNVQWTTPRDVRNSINGTYSSTDLTQGSLGAVAAYNVQVGGSNVISGRTTRTHEVVIASSYQLNSLRRVVDDLYAQEFWSAVPTRSTGDFSSFGSIFSNLGLDDIKGPVTLRLEWPVGFEPFEDDSEALKVLFGSQTIYGGLAFNPLGTPVPLDKFQIVAFDRMARYVEVRFAGPRPDSTFPGLDQVSIPTTTYEEARWVAIRLDGVHVPGVARNPAWAHSALLSEALNLVSNGAFTSESLDEGSSPPRDIEITRLTLLNPFTIIGPAAPTLSGTSTPDVVAPGGSWVTTIDLRNAAYDNDGNLFDNGARLSARDSVVFYRVPRNGDFPMSFQGGALNVRFDRATSGDARPIWVSTAETPPRPTSTELGTSGAWVLCADGGAPCDSAALATISLTPTAVRWVAFEDGEVLVTDAEPRGIRPRGDIERFENPYLHQVELRDIGSESGTWVRPLVYFTSIDTTELLAVHQYDVLIQGSCVETGCMDNDMCTTDTCNVDTGVCEYTAVTCEGDGGVFAPVSDATGTVVGAIRCALNAGVITCDMDPDTNTLRIYPQFASACQ